MRPFRSASTTLTLVATCVLGVGAIHAQGATQSGIRGKVPHSSGQLVPGVMLNPLSAATTALNTFTTDHDGVYATATYIGKNNSRRIYEGN